MNAFEEFAEKSLTPEARDRLREIFLQQLAPALRAYFGLLEKELQTTIGSEQADQMAMATYAFSAGLVQALNDEQFIDFIQNFSLPSLPTSEM
jgi:uncharacterized tellurite resistance protein B-like protein